MLKLFPIILAAVLLAACSAPPTAQVLTTPDSMMGIQSHGTLTGFPLSRTSITIIEDAARGITCYVMTTDQADADIACATTNRGEGTTHAPTADVKFAPTRRRPAD